MTDRTSTTLALKLAAARAAKLADDAEKGRLWEGELERACGEICAHLDEARRNAPPSM